LREREREKRKWRRSARQNLMVGKRNFSGSEGSQAVLFRPCGKGRLKRRQSVGKRKRESDEK
jgi:hypothetical protein